MAGWLLLRVSHAIAVRKGLELEQCGARAVRLAGHHPPSSHDVPKQASSSFFIA